MYTVGELGRRAAIGSRPRWRTAGDRGAVAVEFALVLPVLVMLMLGIVTFGQAFDNKLSLANGVREGGRFGASLPSHAGWETEVVGRTRELLFSSGSTAGLVICAKLVNSAGVEVYASACSLPAGNEPPLPDEVADGDCVVKVWAQRPARLNILLAQWDVDLTAQSVSLYERTPCGEPPA